MVVTCINVWAVMQEVVRMITIIDLCLITIIPDILCC